ncbi:putative translocase of chloroplast, membrane anchor domain-containing protein [Helianthus annuus]|nr:putative translocase of chloroplast, membrane anchor domain-containing protein [Helianthus annuus]
MHLGDDTRPSGVQVQFGSQSDTTFGANIEVQRRELDYPISQVQSTIRLSIIKWRGDLALGFNNLAQFSVLCWAKLKSGGSSRN